MVQFSDPNWINFSPLLSSFVFKTQLNHLLLNISAVWYCCDEITQYTHNETHE